MALTDKVGTSEGKEDGVPFFVSLNNALWNEIEDDLGEITDLELSTCDSPHTPFIINYKSNGEPKSIYLSNYKIMVQSLNYCFELNSPIKKYKG